MVGFSGVPQDAAYVLIEPLYFDFQFCYIFGRLRYLNSHMSITRETNLEYLELKLSFADRVGSLEETYTA